MSIKVGDKYVVVSNYDIMQEILMIAGLLAVIIGMMVFFHYFPLTV